MGGQLQRLAVTRLDPGSGRVVDTIPVGDGPHSIAVTGRRVWVSNEYDGTVFGIDSRTDRVVKRVRLGSSPRDLAASGSAVWVVAQEPTGASHRGSTLTAVTDPVPGYDGVDPAAAWIPEVFSIPYDGFVSFRRTGGPEGFTLVPDLATTLPRPTDGGRTYTFTVRRGIRYSNGVEAPGTGPAARPAAGAGAAHGVLLRHPRCQTVRAAPARV